MEWWRIAKSCFGCKETERTMELLENKQKEINHENCTDSNKLIEKLSSDAQILADNYGISNIEELSSVVHQDSSSTNQHESGLSQCLKNHQKIEKLQSEIKNLLIHQQRMIVDINELEARLEKRSYKTEDDETILVRLLKSCTEYYEMKDRSKGNRGKCIIFSHELFENYCDLEQRNGADEESKTVENTFQKMGFEVMIHKDLKFGKIEKILKKVERTDYSKDDCICFFIMSHGGPQGVHARDICWPLTILEKALSNNNTLVGKPKLIFVQACRGSKSDKGISADGRFTDSSDETDHVINNKKLPTQSDFLIVQSTAPSHYSFRNWFIPTLCRHLEKSFTTKDLITILTNVTNEISRYESRNSEENSKNKCKQTPVTTSILRKKLFFN